MTPDQRIQLLERLVAGPAAARTTRLCEVTAEVTEMSGAGGILMSSDVAYGSHFASNSVSTLIEELQFSLGEGPSIDAYRRAQPVIEPDLARSDGRWLAFTGPAVEAGVRAVFAFPLRHGIVKVGALHVYRDAPGGLTDEQHADAEAMADIATNVVLAMQAAASPGRLAPELEVATNLQHVVHQASGMVAVQLGIKVDAALGRLQAHAFGSGRSLRDVADDVVQRRLRFDGDGEPHEERS